MQIITNCLKADADEGCLKVAVSLVKRMKRVDPSIEIISYDRESPISDHYLELNKLLINKQLRSIVRKNKDSILYIPFPAKAIATALRIFVLSMYKKCRMDVLLVLKGRMSLPARMLLRLSGVNILALSRDAETFYKSFLPKDRVKYIRCGVDTLLYSPVSADISSGLKSKYGFDPERPLILHVGHLKDGRNVGQLLKIDRRYQVLLVASTLTKDERDEELYNRLIGAPNITVINEFVPNIEEIYQMSDVYFFPTVCEGNCIDVPLSCMEAAACNKPVITTDYGEMREFGGEKGYYFIDSFDENNINSLIKEALDTKDCDTRSCVMEYDWDRAVTELLQG